MSATVDALLAVLDDEVLDALADRIADRVADRMGAGSTSRLLTADELATELGVERGWVYRHAQELGAVRLGDGPQGRLRFDSGAGPGSALLLGRQAVTAREPQHWRAHAGQAFAPAHSSASPSATTWLGAAAARKADPVMSSLDRRRWWA